MRISLTASINNTYKSACHKAVQISSTALLVIAMVTLAHAASEIPSKGMTQSEVRNTFGEPSKTKDAVGKPPISRWDYENYSVYFEDNYVIHSFQHDRQLRPRLNPEASTGSPKPSEQGDQQSTSQPAQQMPSEQDPEPQVNEEEIEQTKQDEIEKEIEQEMQAARSEEKDLNFEEDPQNTNYGKWEY